MPCTRSQKGVGRRNEEPIAQEASTGATGGSGTTSGTEGTYPSGTSYETTTTTGAEEEQTVVAAGCPTNSGTRPTKAASAKSTTSVAKRRQELKIREELARLVLEEAQAAAKLARTRLELHMLGNEEEEEDDDSVVSEPPDREEHIERWVSDTTDRMSGEKRTSDKKNKDSNKPAQVVKPKDTPSTTDASKTLVESLTKALETSTRRAMAPNYMHELPAYDGSSGEWLAFKTVYEDTAPSFSSIHNMARLRKAIKGAAREAIKSQLYSENKPEVIMEALRRRFGRPDGLVIAEMKKLKILPKMSDNPEDVCLFASQISNVVGTVKNLKKPQYLQSPEMRKIIVDKMPAVLRYRWFDFSANTEDPDLVMLADFLNREADRCGPYADQDQSFKTTHRRMERREATHVAAAQEGGPCPHCQESHRLLNCKKFLQASTKERWEIAKESRLCYKCLQGRHRKESCKKPACKKCKRWHHSLLHEDRQPEATEATEEKIEVTNNVLQVNAARTTRAYLKMVPVEVYGPKGSARVLALLDEGSTVTLLDASVADQLGLQGPKEALTIETVGGKLLTKKDSMKIDTKIKGVHQNKKRSINGARTIDGLRLTPQTMIKKQVEEYPHLKKMSEQLSYEDERPKLLIGQDNWELIVSRATRKGKKNQPVASLTHLGWVLHGCDAGASRSVNFVTCAHISAREEEWDKMIKEHFAIESLGVEPRRPSNDIEGKAMDILEKTSRRLNNGRFEVGLLWKNEDQEMPDNYTSTETRLKGIEKKLDKDSSFKEEYSKQIQHLLDSGYAEEAPQEANTSKKWYLPHFAVTHPTKKKKRLVFDAAAKHGGKSLNDMLLAGPDLLQSLFGVLLRFRQHPIAVVADIKEMFLQIKIREEDRDSLRFLWRGDRRDGRPQEYRMTSVIFGAACSPSTAIYVKNRNAADFEEICPAAVRAIEKNHYMDDYLHSLLTEDEAIEVASQVDTIHKKAKFELRGWASNSPAVLRKLAQEDGNTEVELGSKEEKTLGLRWFTTEDEMGFRTCLRNVQDVVEDGRTPTKREVTSAVMSTFDPMGLASPVLIQGKRLLQEIWRSGIGWDDKITPENEESWRRYLENLQLLKDLRIPRCIRRSSHEGELHTFTDASETAYACAVYWRQKNEDRYDVMLLAGKARVTPLKPVSIPRLELQAALLGARLARSVEEEMDIKPTKKTYWTDSSTVLSWIRSDPRSFKSFVAHRLAEIEDTTKPTEWRWVSSRDNTADDATRDIPNEFDGSHRWFTGPTFLREAEDTWPVQRSFKTERTGEEKETSTVAAVKTVDKYPTPDPARFSSWNRLLRATARVFQFIDLCKRRQSVNITRKIEKSDPTWGRRHKKIKKSEKINMKKERRLLPIEDTHKERAEKILLQRSQEESFSDEIASLKKEKPIERSSKLKKIDVVHEEGFIRIRGRIDAARGLHDEFKRPIVMDSKGHITRLLIAHYHRLFNHANHATVINEIRQRFWILGLRAAVRATAHECQWCKVYRGTPQQLPAGNLPGERLRYGEPPFTCSAVDYFGPITVTVGRRHEKRWGALFTCLTTRAVHVELAPSLSTSSAILALRRMAARRGTPRSIFSDNGTNLVGANKELKEALEELKKEEVVSEAEQMGIRWKFIPPGAPNMGGAWERLVRSIKTALEATLKEKSPKEEVLHTLVLEAEHLVNSRPLVEKIQDEDEEALTPNHFLIGRSCALPRLGVFTDGETHARSEWKMAQRLVDHFWSRWVKEYLPILIPRKVDGRAASRDLRCGDIVLIVDSTLPRGVWPRGEVVRTYPGPDGRVRIAEVRTKGGSILRRPSSRMIVLVPVRAGAVDDETTSNDIAAPEDGASHEGETVGDEEITSSAASCSRPQKNDDITSRLHYGSEEESDPEEDDAEGPVFVPRTARLFLDDDDDEDDMQPTDAIVSFEWPPQPRSKPTSHRTLSPLDLTQPTESEAPQLRPTSKFEFDWGAFPEPQQSPMLRREPFLDMDCGPTSSHASPYDAFTAIWDCEVMEMIATETNRYAQQVAVEMLVAGTILPRSRITKWRDTTVRELYLFFAIILATGVLVKNRLEEYWNKTDDIFTTPGFSAKMNIDRFLMLGRCLHFQNNALCPELVSRSKAKLFKIQPIVDHLNSRFKSLYKLSQNIALDESLTMWKGRLDINQFISNKAASVGIKTYEVCESATGYLWNFEVHSGHEMSEVAESSPITGFIPSLVFRLLSGLEHKGHTVWMDNFYNSPALARELKVRGFDCAGTLRTSRQFVPNELSQLNKKDMVLGEVLGCTSGDVDIMVWRDTNRVALISTYHGLATVKSGDTAKPNIVPDYNVCMGGVDRKDQMLSMFPIERRRTRVWYKKFFRRLLNVSVLNSYILFKKTDPKMSHRNFRKTLVKQLLQRHGPASSVPNRPQLVSSHFPEQNPFLEMAKRERTRRVCAQCKNRTVTHCKACHVPLCVFTCFELYHSTLATKQ